MSMPGGVQPAVIPLQTTAATVAAIRPGQQVATVLQGTPGNLTAQVAGVRLALGNLPQFQPGQAVLLEVAATANGFKLQITPREGQGQTSQVAPQPATASPPASPTQAPAPATSSAARQVDAAAVFQRTSTADGAPGQAARVAEQQTAPRAAAALPATVSNATVLRSALDALGVLSRLETARPIVPGHIPLNTDAVRNLLALFVERGTVGEDIALIQSQVRQAAQAGILERPVADQIIRVLSAPVFDDASDLGEVLQRLAASRPEATEARVAQALNTGNIDRMLERVGEEVRTQVERLRQNADLVRFVEQRGQGRSFDAAVDRVIERLSGTQVQNLRGMEQPYHFMELAFPAGAAIQHGQVHFFSDGRGGRRELDAKNATVVLDLKTSRLGDLWISMQVLSGRCACVFRTTNDASAASIETDAPELVKQLETAGYPGASVQVKVWHGDRLRETADLMRRFAGLNVRG